MTEKHDTRDSDSPNGEDHDPHLAGHAGQPAPQSPTTEQPSEVKTHERTGDDDQWDDEDEDEDEQDQDRFEVPDGWDDDEPHRVDPADDEGEGLWSFGTL